jgi:6-phosphogluconolactonase
MTKRLLQIFADAEAVSHAAAAEFIRCGADAISRRGRFWVALSGGSTPQRLYRLLSGPPYRDQIDWTKVEVFWGDERCVPPDHKDSNYRMAHEALLEGVPIPGSQIHRIQAERADRDSAARDYQNETARVARIAPSGDPPQFDLVLLGMGPDGHTASLFPFTTALKEKTRWVVVNYVPKFATDRITMTLPILNRTREALFLVAGADKAEPLTEVLEGPPQPDKLPSQLIQPGAGPVVWYVDRAAAARLSSAAGLTDSPSEGPTP